MSPQEYAILSVGLIACATVWHILLILKGGATPSLAGWIILSGTMLLSFATYWFKNINHSMVVNVANATCCVSTVLIVLSILYRRLVFEGGSFAFSNFQKICLCVAAMIAVAWAIVVFGVGCSGFIPNILTQVLMVVGYLPSAIKTFKKEVGHKESVTFWLLLYAGCVAGLGPAIMNIHNDLLPVLYGARSSVTTAIMGWLVARLKK